MATEKTFNLDFILLTAIIFLAAFSRILPHPPNFTPLVALSLLSATHLKRTWQIFLIPLCALFLSDIFLGFHSLMWAVYGAFIIIAYGRMCFSKSLSFTGNVAAVLPSSLFFFFWTNTAVFFDSGLYAKNGEGLLSCYIAGLPFLKNSLGGDLFYALLLYGAATWIRRFSIYKTLEFKVSKY